MAKRNKNKRSAQVGTPVVPSADAKPSVSPPQFRLFISAAIFDTKSEICNDTKTVTFDFPMTPSKLAWEIAHLAFALADELAFKAKIPLSPDKPLKMDYESDDEKIPF